MKLFALTLFAGANALHLKTARSDPGSSDGLTAGSGPPGSGPHHSEGPPPWCKPGKNADDDMLQQIAAAKKAGDIAGTCKKEHQGDPKQCDAFEACVKAHGDDQSAENVSECLRKNFCPGPKGSKPPALIQTSTNGTTTFLRSDGGGSEGESSRDENPTGSENKTAATFLRSDGGGSEGESLSEDLTGSENKTAATFLRSDGGGSEVGSSKKKKKSFWEKSRRKDGSAEDTLIQQSTPEGEGSKPKPGQN